MDLIVFHNSCPDGFAGADIAKLKYPEAKLMPRDHGLEPPYEEVTGKDVLVVDFSWRTRDQNDKLASLAKSFRILDHHKTAEAVLEGASYASFDMNRSGAGLAWDYLFGGNSPSRDDWETCAPEDNLIKPRPFWVNYVEDRDLWKFSLPESEAVNAYIMTFPYEIAAWDAMVKTDLRDAITNGKAILRQINKYVREAVKLAQPGTLNIKDKHYTVGVVNVPYLNTSEVGHALAHRYDVGLGWFERADGMIQFSARSLGDIDVSVIAKVFGGGGHMHAAGFQLPLIKGRQVLDTILGRKLTAYRYHDVTELIDITVGLK